MEADHKKQGCSLFSEFQKRFLLKCTAWTIDETLKADPSHFYQLVTVHGEFFGKFFPLCFILLSSKNERNYKTSFEKLRELTNLHPQTIVIDFVRALYNSLKHVFSGV
ncbi:hypothetical protein CDIK_4250 [Cucumispora dikerogammari]|nr:hypothetical protein CDIK_4250 [Cucumispora dikerogammari]